MPGREAQAHQRPVRRLEKTHLRGGIICRFRTGGHFRGRRVRLQQRPGVQLRKRKRLHPIDRDRDLPRRDVRRC